MQRIIERRWLERSKVMKFKDITTTEEEIVQSLKDAGLEVFTSEEADFGKYPTIKESIDLWCKNRLQAKDIKKFLAQIPDDAQVVLTDGIITCIFNGNTLALNKFGAEWDNGVGYYSDTVVCGECTHFDCSKCGKDIR